ncbi:MAG: hypothetical protein COV76_04650 [Candidatus Omnitrophica bacterium CG11_big_fil_rev_8_21_14_0_20_64_10]|nr:MAG: hypothetical protein COV76_04650 [Candidatus Omnitrophica bacterium CG11_big_fil_rev_8_21_14_0_20_64_10]
MSRVRPLWVGLALALLFLGGWELGLRWTYRETLFNGVCRDHPALGWAPKSNYRADPRYITDERGFFNDPVGLPQPGELRLLVLGDSISGGRNGYPEELERLMAADRPARVINGAVGGYGTAQAADRLRLEGVAYHPDWILLQFFYWNDFEDTLLFQPRSGVKQWLRHSALYRWLGNRLVQWSLRGDLKVAGASSEAESGPADRSGLVRYRYWNRRLGEDRMAEAREKTHAALASIRQTADRIGARWAVVTFHPGQPEDEAALRSWLDAWGVPLIELNDLGTNPALLEDAIHFNAAGHREAADRLRAALAPLLKEEPVVEPNSTD